MEIRKLQQEIQNLRKDIIETERYLKEFQNEKANILAKLQEEKAEGHKLRYDTLDNRFSNFVWAISIIVAVFAAIISFLGRDVLMKSIEKYFDNQAKKLTTEKINTILTEDWLKTQVIQKAEDPIKEAINLLEDKFKKASEQMLKEEKGKMQLHQKEAEEVVGTMKKELEKRREELEKLGIAQKAGNLNKEEKQKVEEYGKALETSKDEEDFTEDDWFWKGNAELDRGDYKDAIVSFSRTITMNPKGDEAWNYRGLAKSKLGNYQEAIEDMNEAIRLNPKSGVAWNNRGFAKNCLENSEEAIEDINEAIRLNPKSDSAWNNRGFAKINLENYEEAIEDLNEAVSLNPKDDVIWSNRGYAKMNLGNYEEALEDLNEAIGLNPDDANPYAHRAYAHLIQDDLEQAAKDIKKSQSIDDTYPTGWYYFGLILQKQDRVTESCEALKKALELGIEEAQDKLDEFCQ